MNVIIVDMIEGFARQGHLASPRIAALIPKQVEFIRVMEPNSKIIFACDAHNPGNAEFNRMPTHCLMGTSECCICPELLEAVQARGFQYGIVQKTTHSPFFNTQMEWTMSSLATSSQAHWTVFGCVTDICILATVMELDYRGKSVTIVRDLIDTYEITKEFATEVLNNPSKEHNPDPINKFFFDYFFPGVMGVKVVTTRQLTGWYKNDYPPYIPSLLSP